MSTNFSWFVRPTTLPTGEVVEADDMDPRIHIGKRSTGFSWAQDPEVVERIGRARPDEKLIVDEYGRRYTYAEFRAACLEGDVEQRFEMIGRAFM